MDIKNIRFKAMLTQEEFSKNLGVSIGIVRRWEQGYEPSLRYKRKLVEFCEVNGIEVWGTEKWNN